MQTIAQEPGAPGVLRQFTHDLCVAINLIGTLSSPIMLLWAWAANLDPRTPAQGILMSVACLSFACLSVAGLLTKRAWLGAIGLAILLGAFFSISGDTGMLTEAEQDAFWAVEWGDAALLRKQLAAGVDPDLHTEDRGYLLTAAVFSKNPELVKILIDAGADVNAHKGDHATPLVMAVYIPRCDAALALGRAGASFAERFYVDAEMADPPTYHGKNVVDIYYGRKREYAKTWKQDEACWLQFESVLEQKKAAAASLQCDTSWAAARRKLYQVFGKFTPC